MAGLTTRHFLHRKFLTSINSPVSVFPLPLPQRIAPSHCARKRTTHSAPLIGGAKLQRIALRPLRTKIPSPSPTPLGEEFCIITLSAKFFSHLPICKGKCRSSTGFYPCAKVARRSRDGWGKGPTGGTHVIQRGRSPRRIPLVDVGKRTLYLGILTSHFVLVQRLVSNRSRARGTFVRDDGKTKSRINSIFPVRTPARTEVGEAFSALQICLVLFSPRGAFGTGVGVLDAAASKVS